MANNIHQDLQAIFAAERNLRDLTQKLIGAPHGDLLQAIRDATAEVEKETSEEERALKLVSLTRILRTVPGPKAIDLVIDILGHESEEARVAAGITLEDIAFDRFGEVGKGIERAVKRLSSGHQALCELPFVILSISDTDSLSLLRPFLALEDAEAVGATIEALVELADPAAIPLLEPLKSDSRAIQVEDDSTGEAEQLTVGALATDAMAALREVEQIVKPAN